MLNLKLKMTPFNLIFFVSFQIQCPGVQNQNYILSLSNIYWIHCIILRQAFEVKNF